MPQDRERGRRSAPKPSRGSSKKPKLVDSTAYGILRERSIKITIGGKEREVSAITAAKHRTFQAALNGDRSAHREVRKWIREREAARPRARMRLPKIMIEYPALANVDQALIILGIASPLPGRMREDGLSFLQLEPWIVQQAIARAGTKKLTDADMKIVRQHTRTDDDDQPGHWEGPQ